MASSLIQILMISEGNRVSVFKSILNMLLMGIIGNMNLVSVFLTEPMKI